jgi:TetR/AcrR family transcriptional repressor of lmrAB and yxaGH operons
VLDRLAGRPASEVAEAFIALWRLVLERSNFGAGCAIVAVTVAADSPVLIERAAEVFRTWRTHLTELLTKGGIRSDRALAVAATLIAACEGAVILSRAEHTFGPFDLVASEQLDTVRRAMIAGVGPGG